MVFDSVIGSANHTLQLHSFKYAQSFLFGNTMKGHCSNIVLKNVR